MPKAFSWEIIYYGQGSDSSQIICNVVRLQSDYSDANTLEKLIECQHLVMYLSIVFNKLF